MLGASSVVVKLSKVAASSCGWPVAHADAKTVLRNSLLGGSGADTSKVIVYSKGIPYSMYPPAAHQKYTQPLLLPERRPSHV